MPFSLIVLAAIVVWVLFSARRPAGTEATAARTKWFTTGLLILLLGLVLARFGQWLAVAGLALLAVLRRSMPLLLRLVPLLLRSRRVPFGGGAPPPGSGQPSGSGYDRGWHKNSPRTSRMDRQQALQVLGLSEGATEQEILDAYRILIKKVHPDRPGGSTYLAAEVNEAKSVLLS